MRKLASQLFLSLRGRHNFFQMSREGSRNEKSYCYQYEKDFNWLSFNVNLVKQNSSRDLVIGFDPSFIRKSGKHSISLGYFYSRCQGSYSKGLELGSFAALEVSQHLAYHLSAIQSPSAKRDRVSETETLVYHYAKLVIFNPSNLKELSNVTVSTLTLPRRSL